jgi:alpha-1,4-digalacturonate transport system permease protein
MAYLFLLPNLLVFGIFILFPMALNVYFAMTSGAAIYPQDRPFVGPTTSSACSPAPTTATPTPASRTASGARRATPACSCLFQVSGMVAISLLTALVLNRKIVARGFFRSVFFYPVLLSPVVVALVWKWILQRDGVLNAILVAVGLEPDQLPARRHLGDDLGDPRQHLGPHGLLHADPARRPAEHPGRALRRGRDRRHLDAAGLPPHHDAAADADDDGRPDPDADPGGADVRRGLRAHRRRPRQRHDALVQYIYTTGFGTQNPRFGMAAAASVTLGAVLLVATLIQLRVGRGSERHLA